MLPAALLALAACSNVGPDSGEAGAQPTPANAASAPASAAAAKRADAARAAATARTIDRPGARWVAVPWSELPGWSDDRTADFWPAMQRSCQHAAGPWVAFCARARLDDLPAAVADRTWRDWLERHLQPYRVESKEGDATGLATGYFEPLVAASRTSRPGFRVPIHAPPADLDSKRPYWTREQLDTHPAAQRALKGREIAYVRDPLDALLLQVQGSGRLVFAGARGQADTVVRVAYAAHNDQPYRSVGRWLIEQGELRPGEASWPAIRAWGEQHPARLRELLWSNPRVVFFREEAVADPNVGPRGAEGVPLSAGRSIAVDPQAVPYGTPVWIDTTEPLATTPLRRLVVAQDTGTAITGAVRADYFWGWGAAAEAAAGRMKQPLRMWVLWPR